MFITSAALSLLVAARYTVAAPLFGIHFGDGTSSDAAPTPVSQSTIDSNLQRPAFFSRVAYCSSPSVSSLSCGAPCDVVNTMTVLQTGGDQAEIPRCECCIGHRE